MPRRTRTLAAMAGGMLIPFGADRTMAQAPAAPDEQPDVQAQLKALTDEVRGLRDENEAMRGEIDELRAATRDEWLTERRAEEIRGIVQDVLADADTRASLQGSGLVAGWDDGFFLASPDGRFKLQVAGQMQARWIFNFHDQPSTALDPDRYRQGFENTRTKLLFGGHVFAPDWEYLIETDFGSDSGNAVLQDAWIRHQLNNDISVRVGQFKLPFTREFLVDSSGLLTIERSLIDGNMNIGRSQGIELTIQDPTWRFLFAFSDGGDEQLGGDNGFNVIGLNPPANQPAMTFDTEYAVTGRFELLIAGSWDQFRDLTSPQLDEFGAMVGIAVHSQSGEWGGSGGRPPRWFAWTADISLEFGGANIFAAFTHHYVDRASPPFGADFFANVYGVVVQAGVYLSPKWEVFGRIEYGWTDFDLAVGTLELSDLSVFTVGSNYYIDGQDLKLSLDLGFGISQIEGFWATDRASYRTDAEDAEPQVVLRTQIQLLF